MVIKVNLNPLEAAILFLHLRRTITYNNIDWAELHRNLRKSHGIWGMIVKVIGKTGRPIKLQAMIYKVVFEAVLLYGSEIWVLEDAMMMVLEAFHHSISRQISMMTVRKDFCGESEWASLDAALETTGIWMIREYVRKRKVKIMEFVAGRPIYDICTDAERMDGVQLVPKVEKPITWPQADIEGGIVKERTVSIVNPLIRISYLSVCRKGEALINAS